MRSEPVREAATAVAAGELIVFPTDTVYGIGTRPDDPDATARVFDAKERPGTLELPVLCPSLADARFVARFDARAEALVQAYWPGALTLVLPRTDASRSWDLGGDRETVGVRIPSHPLASAVLALSGPMATTSANRSGEPTPAGCDDLVETFGDLVAIYLCAQEPLEGVASSVVDLAHGPAYLIREGGLGRASIRRALPPGAPLLDSRLSS